MKPIKYAITKVDTILPQDFDFFKGLEDLPPRDMDWPRSQSLKDITEIDPQTFEKAMQDYTRSERIEDT